MKNHDCSFMDSRGCSRRGALRVLAAAPLLTALPACLHQAHFSAGPAQDGGVFVPAAQLAEVRGPADVLFVRADGTPGTIALRREGEGRYRALLAVCTHRGCE